MTLQEFYTRIGGNYDDTLRRIPSEAIVRKFVLKYPNDPSFGQLKDALAAQDPPRIGRPRSGLPTR